MYLGFGVAGEACILVSQHFFILVSQIKLVFISFFLLVFGEHNL
jgi:hypothetical protein